MRRRPQLRPSMDPVNGMKLAVGVKAVSTDPDLWNLDLSDILQAPQEPTILRPETRRSASCGDLMNDSVKEEVERHLLRKNKSSGTLVRFGTVETRVFERVLEVNPSCSEGPSLGLGWKFNVKKPVSLSTVETQKRSRSSSPFRGIVRKNSGTKKKGLVLSPAKREKMARNMGFSKEEIHQNVLQVQKAQIQREASLVRIQEEAISKSIIRNLMNMDQL